jgi:hypothetical protein
MGQRQKLLLDLSAQGEGKLREFIAQGERLRIRCWDMMGQLAILVDPPGEHKLDLDAFQASASSFHNQITLFLDSWSEVKANLSEGLSRYFRALRHECRKELEMIDITCRAAFELARQDSAETERLAEAVANASQSLNTVLQKLDKLISMASDMRQRVIQDIVN